MKIKGHELTYPHLLLVGIVLVTVTAAAFGLSTSSTAFGSYNPDWDGTRDFRVVASNTGADVEVSQSVDAYSEQPPNRTTAFVLSPTDRYAESDVRTIAAFLDRGGTVVVANDFDSQANPLLQGLGVQSRFDGRLLRDEQHYYRGPSLPVAPNVAEAAITENVSRLTLNHGTAVDPGADSTILVNTSAFAYFDGNRNGDLDESETVRERPVVVSESVGDGRVILVSDPSVFINTMLSVPDNRQFARNLVADSDDVFLDYSHRSGIPWAVAVVLTVADSPWLQLVVVAGLVGVFAVLWSGRRSLRQSPSEPATREDPTMAFDDAVAAVAANHPDWDRDRVEHVARRIITDVSNESEDD